MLDELEVSMHFRSYLFSKEKGGGGVKQMLFFPSTSGNGIYFSRKITETKNKNNKPKKKKK